MQNRIDLLDHGFLELTEVFGDERKIVNAARIAYGAKTNELTPTDIGILKGLLTNGHTSPLEHVSFTFLVKCPIFVARQWMRHRTWSYSELSRRYAKGGMKFYTPEGDDSGEYEAVYSYALSAYNTLLERGVKREQARAVLPVGLYTEFYASVDLNNLLHFLRLREDFHAQYEIRVYAEAIKRLVAPCLPHVAEFLGWQSGLISGSLSEKESITMQGDCNES